MKLIVELKLEFGVDVLKYYNEEYKDNDRILYNAEYEAIHYVIDSDIMPIEGQIVNTHFGTMVVEDSIYDLYQDSLDYLELNRIVVKEF